MLREAKGGIKTTVGNRVKPALSKYFLFFSVSFKQSILFPSRLCSKACQHIMDIVGLSQVEVRRTYLFNSHCYSFMKTNPRIIKAYRHLSFCWQQLFGLLHNITISPKSIRPNKTKLKIIAEKKLVYISTHAQNFSLYHPVTTTPTPNPLSYRHC